MVSKYTFCSKGAGYISSTEKPCSATIYTLLKTRQRYFINLISLHVRITYLIIQTNMELK